MSAKMWSSDVSHTVTWHRPPDTYAHPVTQRPLPVHPDRNGRLSSEDTQGAPSLCLITPKGPSSRPRTDRGGGATLAGAQKGEGTLPGPQATPQCDADEKADQCTLHGAFTRSQPAERPRHQEPSGSYPGEVQDKPEGPRRLPWFWYVLLDWRHV